MRVKIVLDSSVITSDTQPRKFWWQPDGDLVSHLLEGLKKRLQLRLPAKVHLEAKLDGFVVLSTSKTSLLREGDVINVSVVGSRSDNQHGKAAALVELKKQQSDTDDSSTSSESSSSSEEDSSSSESDSDESSSSDDEEFFTPSEKPSNKNDNQVVGQKRPSRSARRKAAKRKLRRMGLAGPGDKLPSGQHEPAPETKQHKKVNVAEHQANGKQQPAPFQKKSIQNGFKDEGHVYYSGSESDVNGYRAVVAREREEAAYYNNYKSSRGRSSQPQQIVAAPSMKQADFEALPLLRSLPVIGDIVAYRILEISPQAVPQVSEIRKGRCTDRDEAAQTLTLEPYPASWRPPHLAYDNDDDVVLDTSLYDTDGSLSVELSSFTEIRLVERIGGYVEEQTEHAAKANEEEEINFKERYSKVGPPRPRTAANPALVTPEGGWAVLAEQLQRRREELLKQNGDAGAAAPKSDPGPKRPGGSGFVRPGARGQSLGPVLRQLRKNGELEME